jgi:hypothetical protein
LASGWPADLNEGIVLKKKLGQSKAPIRPYVCTPAYDGKVDTDYAIALSETMKAASMMGIDVTAAIMGNGAFIDLARNTFVQMFLDNTDCTHLFFIDADLKWEARAFIGLVSAGLPVCAGVYQRRQMPPDYPVKYVEADEGGLHIVKGGWIACERVPTGFLCIERKVIEEMAEESIKLNLTNQPPTPRLFYTKLTEDNRFMGEDFVWCDDYRAKYNEPIWVWPDFDFTHGGYECNWHKHLNEQSERQMGEKRVGKRGRG